MWGKVSCEQQLDTSESVLNLRGNPNQTSGASCLLNRYFGEREAG